MVTTLDQDGPRGMRRPATIAPPHGTLGVLTPGMGAVSTTFMAGVELVRKGAALPIGSLTQLGTIRLGKRTQRRSPLIREFVPLENRDAPVRARQPLRRLHTRCRERCPSRRRPGG